MASVMNRVNALVGKMSYKQWVLIARHEQQYGRMNSLMLFNTLFFGMGGYIIFDGAQHRKLRFAVAAVVPDLQVERRPPAHQRGLPRPALGD
jgi:hypothetical protein